MRWPGGFRQRKYGSQAQIRPRAVYRHAPAGRSQHRDGLQRIGRRGDGAHGPPVFLPDQAGDVGRARDGGARHRDADRLPHLQAAGVHLDVAGSRGARSRRGAVQSAGEQRAPMVRDRRPGRAAVRAGEARRDLLHRGPARTAHAPNQRAGILAHPHRRRRRGPGGLDPARAGLRHLDVARRHRRGDGLRRRTQLHLHPRRGALRSAGHRVSGDGHGLPAAAGPDLSQSLGRSRSAPAFRSFSRSSPSARAGSGVGG